MPDKELEGGQFWEFQVLCLFPPHDVGPLFPEQSPILSSYPIHNPFRKSSASVCKQPNNFPRSLASCLVPSLIPWTALFEVFIPHKIVYKVKSMFLQTSKWFLQSIQVCPNNQIFFMKSLTCLCKQQSNFPKSLLVLCKQPKTNFKVTKACSFKQPIFKKNSQACLIKQTNNFLKSYQLD